MTVTQELSFEEWNGVRVFPDHSTAETEEGVEKLNRLLEDAQRFGCVEAIKRNNHDISYLTSEKRAKYLDFLEIDASDHVLEIGASMGQHTRLLAKSAGRVEALEVIQHQAAFAKLWCEESGCDNVSVSAGGASGNLPYADDSFDLVILNYVLEWCAGRSDLTETEFHRQFLVEICRVLRSGGRLFISTKNRYALRLLLGSVDEHLDIRFGSALPRGLARVLSPPDKMNRPQGFLHSRRAFEELLNSAGFDRLEPILCFPDARYPTLMSWFDAGGLRSLRTLDRSGLSAKLRLYLALPAAIQKRTAASHVYLAWKPAST